MNTQKNIINIQKRKCFTSVPMTQLMNLLIPDNMSRNFFLLGRNLLRVLLSKRALILISDVFTNLEAPRTYIQYIKPTTVDG